MDVISRSFIVACLFWICLHGQLTLAQSIGQVYESAFTAEQERLLAEDVMADHELADSLFDICLHIRQDLTISISVKVSETGRMCRCLMSLSAHIFPVPGSIKQASDLRSPGNLCNSIIFI